MFDMDDVELSPDATRQFERDTEQYFKSLSNSATELDTRKAQDDAFTNVLLSTISKLVKDSIQSNPLMAAHAVLPSDNCERTKSYLTILSNQYSKGNSTTTVAEISKFFSLQQTYPDISAVFLGQVADQLARVRPLIESTDHPGHVSIDKLLSLVIIKGLDKKQAPNLRALEIHVQTHDENVLDVPGELIHNIIAMQISDLANLTDHDPEVSAFVSSSLPSQVKKPSKQKPTPPTNAREKGATTTTPRPAGAKIPSRDDHCTNCLTLIDKYFYHPTTSCNRKPPPTKAFPAILDDPVAAREARISLSFATLRQEGYDFMEAPAHA
jgi:hypothetical protein